MNRVLILILVRFGWSLCPDGWHGDVQTDWCYKPFESGFEKSWNAAESHCQSFGGDLTAINSKRKGYKYIIKVRGSASKFLTYKREQEMIVSILNRRWYDYYWIGLNDLARTGQYEWVSTDGSDDDLVYDFEFWAPGMPSDADGSRCTFMLFSDNLPGGETYGREGKWVKGICNKAGKYICRVKQDKFVTNCPAEFTYSKVGCQKI